MDKVKRYYKLIGLSLIAFAFTIPTHLSAQSAYFGGKGDGHAMTQTSNIALSIDKAQEQNKVIRMYPNPLPRKSPLTIKLDNELGEVTFQFINQMGNPLKRVKRAAPEEGPLVFSLSALPAGIYFVQIQADRDLYQKKLVITGH